MLYNSQLKTFVTVADCGSFTRASESLFISPTAIMKQINALEDHLDLKLFERSSHGIHLTPAGEVIYKDAKFLFAFSEQSIERAKAAMNQADTTFSVGTSLLNPAKPFMDLWYQVSKDFENYKLRLVPFDDDHEGILAEIGKLGDKFDFLIGVCDSKMWLDQCQMLPLGRYKKMVAVSRDNPLAARDHLSPSDLEGHTLMMVREGDSAINDYLRHDLQQNHPGIVFEDTSHFYDIGVFNRCAQTDNILLTIECWKDVHPGVVTIPVDWDYSIPYGLLYSNAPRPEVKKFVHAVENLMDRENASSS